MSRLFASTSRLFARTRTTTHITGLAVHPAPLPRLLELYGSTLSAVSSFPASSVYRQAVESITKERISVVERLRGQEAENDIENVEREIGEGCIEEVIGAAEDELSLAGKMAEWKPWEELEEKPLPDQWEPFKIHASTTNADDLK